MFQDSSKSIPTSKFNLGAIQRNSSTGAGLWKVDQITQLIYVAEKPLNNPSDTQWESTYTFQPVATIDCLCECVIPVNGGWYGRMSKLQYHPLFLCEL